MVGGTPPSGAPRRYLACELLHCMHVDRCAPREQGAITTPRNPMVGIAWGAVAARQSTLRNPTTRPSTFTCQGHTTAKQRRGAVECFTGRAVGFKHVLWDALQKGLLVLQELVHLCVLLVPVGGAEHKKR